MTKIDSLSDDLKKALERLEEASNLKSTDINRDATIQRFEFCFELSWKLMQAILSDNGIESYGPKNSIREAAKLGLIKSPSAWLEFLKARNLTSHTYEEKTAREVYEKAIKFTKPAKDLVKNSLKK